MSGQEIITILLVEDDPGHARFIEKNLKRVRGKDKTVVLENGKEALNYIFSRKNCGDMTEISKCYKLGCNIYIIKTINYSEFSKTIRNPGSFISIIKFPSGSEINAKT